MLATQETLATNPEVAPDEQMVRAHLKHVVSSSQFSNAPKLARFLRFIVETVLAGDSDQIKESLIAVEVYGRRPDYNPQIDSTVRVEASRLRARLRQYYESAGQDQPVEIDLPKGKYIPVFRKRALEVTRLVEPVPEPQPQPQQRARKLSWIWLVSGPVLVCILLMILRPSAPVLAHAKQHPVSPVRPTMTADRETTRLYLHGYELLRIPVLKEGTVPEVPATVFEAVHMFEEVTRREPSFAPGWVGLAEANEWLYELDKHRPPERLIAAKAAAQRSVHLAPNLPEAWTVLTSILFFREWDIPAAEEACRRAIELNPRDRLAQQRYVDLLRLQGRWDEAAQHLTHAVSLNPSVPNLRNRQALLLLERGQTEEAIAEAAVAESLNPHREQLAYTMSLWIQAVGHQRQGRLEKAEALYRKACAYQAHDPWSEPSLAHLLAVSGRKAEALGILRELQRQQSLGRPQYKAMALVYAGLGNAGEALTWLERGYAERDPAVLFTALDWRFAALQSEPQFQALLARIQRTANPSGNGRALPSILM